MKRSTFVWACFALINFTTNLTTLQATPTDSIFIEGKGKVEKVDSKTTVKSELKTVSFIPNQSLSIKLSQDQKYLVVDLETESTEMLDWIIFETGGDIVSRIKTPQNIDEIKVSKLEKGNYVLMIKDQVGRLIYQPFQKA